MADKKKQFLLLIILLSVSCKLVYAHGDMQPQPIDTAGLPSLGDQWRDTNPYRGNALAIKIGNSGFNQNCARCHGLEAISGGIAPDLRYLPLDDEGDGYFKQAVTHGKVRDGRVYMPKFDGILTQEGLWAIRTYIQSRHENED